MHADDELTKPYQLSYGVQVLLTNAIEHARAISRLAHGEEIAQGSPSFTLARAAVESAAIGYWLLSPTDERERVKRHRIHLGQDRYDHHEVSKLIADLLGTEIPAEIGERRTYIAHIQVTTGLETLPKQLGATSMIRDVDKAIDTAEDASQPTMSFELFWRTASGFGHGRP